MSDIDEHIAAKKAKEHKKKTKKKRHSVDDDASHGSSRKSGKKPSSSEDLTDIIAERKKERTMDNLASSGLRKQPPEIEYNLDPIEEMPKKAAEANAKTTLEDDEEIAARTTLEDDEDGDDNAGENTALVSLEHQGMSLKEMIWPPFRVAEDSDPKDRKLAHVFLVFLLLCFAAAAGWTIYKAFIDDGWTSTYEVEQFPFPTVTICGAKNVERPHTILKSRCGFYWLDTSRNTEDGYATFTCGSKIVDKMNIEFDDWLQGKCVVYNPNGTQETRSGNLEIELEFQAEISEINSTETDDYFIREPSYYYMMLSKGDLSEEYNDEWYFIYTLETSGLVSFTVDYTEQLWKNESEPQNAYSISHYIRLPWHKGNDDEYNKESDQLVRIYISPSDTGNLILKQKRPDAFVVMGSLWALFGFVTTVFYIFFTRDLNQPNVLIRRVKDMNTMHATLKENTGTVQAGAKLMSSVVSS
jgi:hypothetical protein